MTVVESQTSEQAEAATPKESWADRLRREPSTRTVVLVLVGVALLSAAARLPLMSLAHAPTVFSDELSYSKLALALGKTGHLALLDHRGLSYSPLYPLVLSPIYALGASAPTAYTLIKVVNVFLVSLSIFATYNIARFVLPRRLSLLAAGLSAILPVLAYSSFVMSENLGYPACLFSVWAMLAALRQPGPKTDAILLLSIAISTLARLQLIVLVPVALTAFVVAAAFTADEQAPIARSPGRAVREHKLVFGVVVLGLVAAGLAALSGRGIYSLLGSYSVIGNQGTPDIPHFFKLFVEHFAGLEFAVGVVPFVGTLVAGYLFIGSRRSQPHAAFAAVGLSLTAWLLAEAAYLSAQFDTGLYGSVPRIHERYFVYVAPLFLIAFIAAWTASRRNGHGRVYLVAAGIAVVLSLLIPYHTVINNTVAVDSIGLELLTRVYRGRLSAYPHAPLVAAWMTATFAFLYYFVRARLRMVLLIVLLPILFTWLLEMDRIDSSSTFARAQLPAHTDWVDRAHPAGEVAVITTRRPTAELQTTFANHSITRAYYVCQQQFGADYGEQQATISRSGLLRAGTPIKVPYVVAPVSLGVRGRIVARNRPGREVLVAPANTVVRVAPGTRAARLCR